MAGIKLLDRSEEATEYRSILDFQVSWYKMPLKSDFKKEDVQTFELVDKSLNLISFDPYAPLEHPAPNLHVAIEPEAFELLKNCAQGNSHWLRIDGEWLAFPENHPDKVGKVNSIDYYLRGLLYPISRLYYYRNTGGYGSIPTSYRYYKHKQLLFHEGLLSLYVYFCQNPTDPALTLTLVPLTEELEQNLTS